MPLSERFSRPLRRERIETLLVGRGLQVRAVSPGLCVGSGLKHCLPCDWCFGYPSFSRPLRRERIETFIPTGLAHDYKFLPASASGAD